VPDSNGEPFERTSDAVGWVAPKSGQAARTSFTQRFGFSKQQRRLGEELLAANNATNVLDTVERWLPQLDAVNAVTALNRIAKSAGGALAVTDARFEILEGHAATSDDPRCLANSAWAFATLLYANQPLLTSISAAAMPPISQFCPQGLANIAWSWSTLALSDKPLLAAISASSIPR